MLLVESTSLGSGRSSLRAGEARAEEVREVERPVASSFGKTEGRRGEAVVDGGRFALIWKTWWWLEMEVDGHEVEVRC